MMLKKEVIPYSWGWCFLLCMFVLLQENFFCVTSGASIFSSRTSHRHEISLLERGHSHNDYVQAEPFDSAIQHGLKSIEVDVFPRKGGLFVAHTIFELDPAKRIDSMYIKPLLSLLKRQRHSRGLRWKEDDEKDVLFPSSSSSSWLGDSSDAHLWAGLDSFPTSRLKMRGGTRKSKRGRIMGWVTNPSGGKQHHSSSLRLIGPDTGSLTLLVDFKGHPDTSTLLLDKALIPLRPFLSHVTKDGVFKRGKVTVVISGNKPSEDILLRQQHTAKNRGNRYLFLDGRAKDIRLKPDTALVPMVSIPWRTLHLARCLGRGEICMRRLVHKAHEQGKLLRIWGAPNDEKVWKEMVRSNVDLLSIDDHGKFARFVRAQQALF